MLFDQLRRSAFITLLGGTAAAACGRGAARRARAAHRRSHEIGVIAGTNSGPQFRYYAGGCRRFH
jgi:hypothetical protein